MYKFFFFFLSPFLLFGQDYNQLVKGTIRDEFSGNPIAGASVSFLKKGTFSDSLGNYSLKVPWNEEVFFVVSSLGYYPIKRSVLTREPIVLDFLMKEDVRTLKETVVESKKSNNISDNSVGKLQINLKNIKYTPMAFGQTDLLKIIAFNAGVSSIGEGSGGFNVRGGRVDQNLVLFDDAPIFNTSHLLGFFSVINTETLQTAELYKAFIPANYGGRLSSLLRLEPKIGNSDSLRGTVSLGVISSYLNLDGPIGKNKKLLFNLGSRIAYPNFAISKFPTPTNKSRAFFDDFNGNISYLLSKNDNVRFSFLNSFDTFKFPQDTSYSWKSRAYALGYNHSFSKNLNGFVKVIQSQSIIGLKGLTNFYDFEFVSKLVQNEFKSDLMYSTQNISIDLGFDLIKYNFSPGQISPSSETSIIASNSLGNKYAREMVVFVNMDNKINKFLSFQVGLRGTVYQATGARVVYDYDLSVPLSKESIIDTLIFQNGQVIKTYPAIEPRFSAKFALNGNTSLKLSYNVTRQFLHLISNTTAISPLDFWIGSDRNIKPQAAIQYAIGVFQNLNENAYEFSIEAYYKNIKNMLEYKNGANLFMNNTLETDLLNAIGKAYGLEFSTKKKQGFFTWSLAYTYSRTFAKVSNTNKLLSINNGNWFPSNYDRPHNLAFTFQWALAHNWNLSSNFVYISGRPITFPDGQYTYFDTPVINYYYRNMDRIPSTHRLDVSITKDFKKNKDQKRYSSFGFSIYNVYGRKNAYSIYFERFNTLVLPKRLAVLGAAIPSINYTFTF